MVKRRRQNVEVFIDLIPLNRYKW